MLHKHNVNIVIINKRIFKTISNTRSKFELDSRNDTLTRDTREHHRELSPTNAERWLVIGSYSECDDPRQISRNLSLGIHLSNK